MKIVCIHWGTKYDVEYVNVLNAMVKRHSSAELICLSDSFEGKDCEVMMLDKGLEGWWNKIQLFKPNFLNGEKFLYLDLDVVITQNIDCFFDCPDFTIIDDWIFDTYNSSVMVMSAHPHVYDLFMKDPEKAMKSCPQGDQQWISNYIQADETFPRNYVSSFRMDRCEDEPKGKIVVFHGKPDPHEVKGTWVEEHWK